MKQNAPITFDGYTWTVNYKRVANPDFFVGIFKQCFTEPPKADCTYGICSLQWVNDGDQIWIVGNDQKQHIPYGAVCGCSVPLDVHGTCCGWRNAKHTCDPKSLRIVDDRHPGYNKSLNEYINSGNLFVTQ